MSARCRRRSILFLLLVLIAWAGSASALCYSGKLLGHSRWQGEVELTEAVIVPAEASLTIEPGTRITARSPQAKLVVEGTLSIEGTDEKPVVFATPAGWLGIELMEAAGKALIRQAHFSDAERAVASYGSRLTVEKSRFENCATAVHLVRESPAVIVDNRFFGGRFGVIAEMKSAPQVSGNLFSGQTEAGLRAGHSSHGPIYHNRFIDGQTGMALQQPFPNEVRDNDFSGNRIGLFCNQTRNTPKIIGNRFENNESALVNYAFSFPVVTDNIFTGNKVALRNDQYGSPLVEHNLFRDNGTAIYNYRKSNPKVRRNQVEGNKLALFCDYSSYPEVRDNNFLRNDEGVRLGIYQSADWEKRAGSKPLMLQQARQRNSRNDMLGQAPTDFVDRVDVSGNWWGADSERLRAAGADANDALFWDVHDQPTVVYEGFGDEAYRLDRVVFQPVLDGPVDGTGPRLAERAAQ
ncbi:MAG: hypothetical protein D6740_01390 [Alphaproteobacteria bacterium]|nr:MAG: hypothetical protein D6740_01390 [Alphaproteobacteria bacterium]